MAYLINKILRSHKIPTEYSDEKKIFFFHLQAIPSMSPLKVERTAEARSAGTNGTLNFYLVAI